MKYNKININDKELKQVMLEIGWENILSRSEEINNSIKNINKLENDFEIFIISKVNSEEEIKEKTRYLDNHNIKNKIFVPYNCSKADAVIPNNDVLIDDDINNLDEWNRNGGISILFNKKLENIDSYGHINTKYIIIDDLLKIYDIIK